MPKLRVLLVRHGQSQANVDWGENKRQPDHAIELTDDGHDQARQCGEFLAEYFATTRHSAGAGRFLHHNVNCDYLEGPKKCIKRIRLWHSPYVRTRQTALGIVKSCRLPEDVRVVGYEHLIEHHRKAGDSWFIDDADSEPVPHAREKLHLAEQRFGLFDGLSDEERRERYPDEQANYEKAKQAEGKMWPIIPLGDSRYDVCIRVHAAFGSFHRDKDKHGITTIVVIGHGTTNRAFAQMWLHKPWEWMHREPNPNNCSVRLIEDGKLHPDNNGYIFDGFPPAKQP